MRVVRRGPFAVHGRLDPGGVAGWMVVAPVRHVERVEALTADEQAALMPLLTEVAGALRAETPCEKTYLAVFSEVLTHVHVHVIARPPELDPAQRGPRIFDVPPVSLREATAVSDRVVSRLASAPAAQPAPTQAPSSRKDPAFRAALLSALVCPGAGQIRNRQYLKGAVLVLGVFAAAGTLFVRMLTEVFRVLPTDGTPVDPLSAWDLAHQIQEKNHGEFLFYSVALAALWVYATLDAWFGARRQRAAEAQR